MTTERLFCRDCGSYYKTADSSTLKGRTSLEWAYLLHHCRCFFKDMKVKGEKRDG